MYIGDAASPESFDEWCEIFNIPEFGQTNGLVDVTAFCNGGFRQYKGALADGLEVEFQGNHVPNSTVQKRLRDAVINKSNINIRIDDENISPTEQYTLNVVSLSWRIGPVVDNRNTFIFGCKINTITVPA
jgi:hypothetical protein